MRFQKSQPAGAATLVPHSASTGPLKNMDASSLSEPSTGCAPPSGCIPVLTASHPLCCVLLLGCFHLAGPRLPRRSWARNSMTADATRLQIRHRNGPKLPKRAWACSGAPA